MKDSGYMGVDWNNLHIFRITRNGFSVKIHSLVSYFSFVDLWA